MPKEKQERIRGTLPPTDELYELTFMELDPETRLPIRYVESLYASEYCWESDDDNFITINLQGEQLA